MGKKKDSIKEQERRRKALRMMIIANGNSFSEYGKRVGISRSTIHKMLSGEQRVSDRALGLNDRR